MSILKSLNPNIILRRSNKGTDRHIRMTFTSLLLIILIPTFIFTFGKVFGASYDEVNKFLSQPINAIIVIFTLVISFIHFKQGVRILIEDYVRGSKRKILLSLTTILSYGAIVISLYSITTILLQA